MNGVEGGWGGGEGTAGEGVQGPGRVRPCRKESGFLLGGLGSR